MEFSRPGESAGLKLGLFRRGSNWVPVSACSCHFSSGFSCEWYQFGTFVQYHYAVRCKMAIINVNVLAALRAAPDAYTEDCHGTACDALFHDFYSPNNSVTLEN